MSTFGRFALALVALALVAVTVNAANGNGDPFPTRPGSDTTGPTIVAVASNLIGLSIAIPVDTGSSNSNGQSRDWGADPILDWIVTYSVQGQTTNGTDVECTGVLNNPCPAATSCLSDIGCGASSNTAASCLITGLTPSTSYSFTVRARNPQGLSAASVATVQSTLATTTNPDTLTAPTLVWFTSTQVSLSVAVSGGLFGAPLNHGVTAITSYEVTVRTGTTTVRTVTTPNTCTSLVIDTLQANTAYTFTSRAVNASQKSGADSPTLAVTTSAAGSRPAAMAAPTIVWYTSNSAYLTWNFPQDQGASVVTSYVISRTGGKGTQPNVTTPNANTCAIVTGLTPGAGKPNVVSTTLYGEAYRFTLAATNTVGTTTTAGTQSAALSLPRAEAPNLAATPSIAWYTSTEVRLSWSDIPLAQLNSQASASHGVDQIVSWIVGFNAGASTVEQTQAIAGLSNVGSLTRSDAGQSFAATVSGLTAATAYTFSVSGVNSLGTRGLKGPTVGITTAALNTAPVALTTVTLIWFSSNAGYISWSLQNSYNMGTTKVTSFSPSVSGVTGTNTVAFADTTATYFQAFSGLTVTSATVFSVVVNNGNGATNSASTATTVNAGTPVATSAPDNIANANIDVIAYNANTVVLRFPHPQNMNGNFASQYTITPIVSCGTVTGSTCGSTSQENYNGNDGIVPAITAANGGQANSPANGNVYTDLRTTSTPVSTEQFNVVTVSSLQPAQTYNFRITAQSSVTVAGAATTRVNSGALMTTEVTLPNTTPSAPTDLNDLATGGANNVFRVQDGFIIELNEPVNHGESAILSSNGYVTTFYQRTPGQTINSVTGKTIYKALSSTCQFNGVRVGQTWERNNLIAFKLRGLCTGITSTGDNAVYRYDVRAVNTIGSGVPTLRTPSVTTDDVTTGVSPLTATPVAFPAAGTAALVWTSGTTALVSAAVTKHNNNLWNKVTFTCDNNCASQSFDVSTADALRYNGRYTVQFADAARGTTVSVTASYTSAASTATASTSTAFNVVVNPAAGNAASKPGVPSTVTQGAAADNQANADGYRSPLWQTTTSAAFLVKASNDYGSAGQSRYVFSFTSAQASTAANRNSVRCISTLSSAFGALFGELSFTVTAGGTYAPAVADDVNLQYSINANQCISNTDLDNTAADDTKRGRVTSWTATTGTFTVATADTKPTLQTEPAIAAVADNAFYAAWMDGSCQVPLVCQFSEVPAAGKAATSCVGGTGCTKTPALNGGLGMLKIIQAKTADGTTLAVKQQVAGTGSLNPVAGFTTGFRVPANTQMNKLTLLGASQRATVDANLQAARIGAGCLGTTQISIYGAATTVLSVTVSNTLRYIPVFAANVAFAKAAATTQEVRTSRTILATAPASGGATCTSQPFISTTWANYEVTNFATSAAAIARVAPAFGASNNVAAAVTDGIFTSLTANVICPFKFTIAAGASVSAVTAVSLAATCTNPVGPFEFMYTGNLNNALAGGIWRYDAPAAAAVATLADGEASGTSWGAGVTVTWPGWGCTTTNSATGVGITVQVIGTTAATLIPTLPIYQQSASLSSTDQHQYFTISSPLIGTADLQCQYSVGVQACSGDGGNTILGDGTGAVGVTNANQVCSTFSAAAKALTIQAPGAPAAPSAPTNTAGAGDCLICSRDGIRQQAVQRVIGNTVSLTYFTPVAQGTDVPSSYTATYTATGAAGTNLAGNPNQVNINTAKSVSAPADNDFVAFTSKTSGDLTFSQTYSVQVRAVNSVTAGGTLSAAVSFTTAALTPDQIGSTDLTTPSNNGFDGAAGTGAGQTSPGVINFTSTNATVAYTPPRRHGKAFITKYTTIPYFSATTPVCTNARTESTTVAQSYLTVLSQVNDRLVPFGATYAVQVIASNVAGDARGGQLSTQFVTNDNDVPASATSGNGCSAPATVYGYGSALQTVCWAKNPNFGRDIVSQYRLSSFTGSLPVPTASTVYIFANADTSGAVQGLTGNATNQVPNTDYTYRVEAKNTAGFNGGYSIMTAFQPSVIKNSRAALPGVPRNLAAIRSNMDSVTVQWDVNPFTSYSGGSVVQFYVIGFSSTGFGANGFNAQTKQVAAPSSTAIATSTTMTTIADLASSEGDNNRRTYVFTATAINAIGRSPASPSIQQATASSPAMGMASLSLLTIALVALLALLL